VALRNVDLLEQDKPLPRVAELELTLAKELTLLQGYQEVVDTRVAGLLGGVTLAERLGAESVTDELIEHGFITRPLRGNTVQISLPFITTDGEIRRLVAALGPVITALATY